MFDFLIQIAPAAGVFSALIVAVASLSSLSERSRRHKSVERWTAALTHIEDEQRRAIVERLIRNDIARLIAIRQQSSWRMLPPLIGLVVLSTIWIMAVFEQADLYFDRADTPNPTVFFRLPDREALVSAATSLLAIAGFSWTIYEHRAKRARLYLEAGGYNWSGRPPLHAPVRVLITSFGGMGALLALLWMFANWRHESGTGPMGNVDAAIYTGLATVLALCLAFQSWAHYELSRVRREDPREPPPDTRQVQRRDRSQMRPRSMSDNSRTRLLAARPI